ncbi:uncharacterized protein VTP21DRAFT_6422 [Calcarisporiella thermophila]|uniref:uncharacterized protein n=1 Tax=Calcarisporiella thermophila TaxID=911321 RepID=UPI0037449A02
MTSFLAKKVITHVLGESAGKMGWADMPEPKVYIPPEEPRFFRKWFRKKNNGKEYVGPKLSAKDQAVLKKVKKRANMLDEGFNCCCCRVGLDFFIGLIPFVGDCITLYLSVGTIRMAKECETPLPGSLIRQMYTNSLIDFVFGLIPFVGDIIDAIYKANIRNSKLLENYLWEHLYETHQGNGGASSTPARADTPGQAT